MEIEELESLIRCHPKATEVIQETLRERNVTGEAKVKFDIEPLLDDFRLLDPGTNIWRRFWMAHPEKQEKMIEWKEMLIGGIFSHV